MAQPHRGITARSHPGAIQTASVALLAAFAAWYLALALGFPLSSIVNGLLDDSFYYLQVARNVAAGHGSTFDRVEPTNGYHPLWMLALVPVCAIARGDPEWTLRLALLLAGGFGILSLVKLRSVLEREAGSWPAAMGLLLFAWPRFFFQTTNLLETGLLLVLQLALLECWLLEDDAGYRPAAWLRQGLLMGLVCLARLDSVFLLVAWAAREGGRGLRARAGPRGWRRSAVIGAVALAVIAPYLLWNLARFGHVQPISGAMKSSFPHPVPHWEWLWSFPDFDLLLLVAAGFAVGGLRRGASPVVRTLALFGWAALLQMAYLVAFVGWGVDRWYFTLLFPVALVGLPWLARDLLANLPRRPAIAWGAMTLAFVGAVLVQEGSLRVRHGRYLAATAELARWSAANLPRGSVVAMTDAGVFAWFSNLTTVNLDGLINNWRYRDQLRAGRLREYLIERGVGYVFDQYHAGHPDWLNGTYFSRKIKIWYRPEHRIAGEVEVWRSDEVRRTNLLARLAPGRPPEANALILWRYRGVADVTPR